LHQKGKNHIFVALLLIPIFQAGPLHAADWSFSPSLRIAGEYNSNVLLRSELKLEDFIAVAQPEILNDGVKVKSQFRFDTVVQGEKYISHDEFDTINNFTDASLVHQWSPKFSTDFKANFVKDQAFETELEQVGLVAVRTDRFRYGLELATTYSPFETSFMVISASADRSQYPDGIYPDLGRLQAGLNPGWLISTRDTIGIRFNYLFGDYRNIRSIQTPSGEVYWNRDFSDTAFLTLGAGYRYTWVDITGTDITKTDNGFIFSLTLHKDWTDRFYTSISAGRDQYLAVNARVVENNYVRAALNYRMTEVISLNCDIAFDFNTKSGPDAEDSNYYRITPYVGWRISDSMYLRLWGQYGNIRIETDQQKRTSEQYRTWLTFDWYWSRLLANR